MLPARVNETGDELKAATVEQVGNARSVRRRCQQGGGISTPRCGSNTRRSGRGVVLSLSVVSERKPDVSVSVTPRGFPVNANVGLFGQCAVLPNEVVDVNECTSGVVWHEKTDFMIKRCRNIIVFVLLWLYGRFLECHPSNSAGKRRLVREISEDKSKRASRSRDMSTPLLHVDYVNANQRNAGALGIIFRFVELLRLFLQRLCYWTKQKVPRFSNDFHSKSRDLALVQMHGRKIAVHPCRRAIGRCLNYSCISPNGFWHNWLALQAVINKDRPMTSPPGSVTSSFQRSGMMTSELSKGI